LLKFDIVRIVRCSRHITNTREIAMAVKTRKHEGEATKGMSHTTSQVADGTIRDLVQVARLVSDETRLRILFDLVKNGELNVTDICNRLGQSQPAISHHLALLRVSGLIEPRREGKHNFYSVRGEAFADLLHSLLSSLGEMPRKVKFHDFMLSYTGN
jgi:ArsR family transcriptional regulator